ncbi:MAG: hypothetical protein AAFP19_17115, partial [Bacteroidota bacterium]
MKNKILLFLLLLPFIACQHQKAEKPECTKFKYEIYQKENTDSALIANAHDTHQFLLNEFNEFSLITSNHEAYHLQFYSSHGYGQSIKFEKKLDRYTLSVKCLDKKNSFSDCEAYQVDIHEEEWKILEKMIYEFDFWTTERFRVTEGVLDGNAILLEGKRPAAAKCGKRTYRLVGRGSPIYDKIGALCDNILSYEGQLLSNYKYQKWEN